MTDNYGNLVYPQGPGSYQSFGTTNGGNVIESVSSGLSTTDDINCNHPNNMESYIAPSIPY